jgi:hypothetical protein
MTVGGAFAVTGGTLPELLQPASLAEAGAVVVTGTSGIRTVDLPRLEWVTGALRIEDLPDLEAIVHTSDLEGVLGDLAITGNPALGRVEDFAFLGGVGGDLEIGGNGAVTVVDGFWSVGWVGGTVRIHDEPLLVEVGGFGALEDAGGVEVRDCGSLSTWLAPGPALVTGDVVLLRNPALVGPPFALGLTSIGGTFQLEDLDLDPLLGLSSVGGDLVIRGNASLSADEISGLVDGLTVGGTVTIEDNGT